ncbi:MAG TPA: hemolysin family protein [Candidatus Aminicenantes bacterium]|nr:hemolysin family protein [Candidatus Aminicenantes bacterium]HRY66245.1 hemolysin family protein [Candidatus Aminicenantes bacterium]HRZ73159.1 hemolysin family protein [Candidatus Aminicenantes bacterium]
MIMTPLTWLGLALAFAAAFALSLFHIALGAYSKISLSRFLEDRERADRAAILKDLEETRLAVEFLRMVVILGLAVYGFAACRGLGLGLLWIYLAALAVYGLVLDLAPRLLVHAAKPYLMRAFLPAFRLVRVLAFPILAVSRGLIAREEQREEKDEDREASDEEIETFIDEATEEGIIDKGENELLRSVVEFGDTVVREVMTPRLNMVCIRREATVDNLKDLIIREKYSRIPVYRDRLDNIEGIVMAKDIIEYADEKQKALPIVPLIRPAAFVPESMPVPDLLREFQKVKNKMAIVVDEHGGVSGLVTMEDVVEEIVGEIQDEYDTEEAQIAENGPLDFTVSGATEVEELEELFDTELAEDDFITVGGLITSNLGRLPHKGETLAIKGLRVEVLDVDQKKVKKARIRKA